MALTGSNNQEKIWNYFKAKGLTEIGIAGLMGNLQAESGLNPKNMQNSYESKLGFNDETYTSSIDNGSYTNFVQDKVGYGLAQWTYWSRKQNLLNFAKQQGKSIGSLEMQLDFLYQELTIQYKPIWTALMNAQSIRQASDVILTQFEKPANQGPTVQEKRAAMGQNWFNIYATKTAVTQVQQQQPIPTASGQYSNSPLATFTRISPNKTSPRNHAIDTITIHCMAGNGTVESCGNLFANPSRQASSNYGIGSDGRIGMYVEEKDRSWCSSNSANDHRAITIEVANDGGAPDWHVSDKALASLIKLCADICKRNNIKKLLWQGDKNLIGQVNKQNMTVHRWFAAKACPGDYLYNKHGYIAEEVNKLLGVVTTPPVNDTPAPSVKPVENTVSTIAKGQKIKLLSTKCYANSSTVISFGIKSGTFYLWDDTVVNGRIRITIAKSYVGVNGKVTCWVNVSDIFGTEQKPKEKIKAGAKLTLNNTPIYSTLQGASIGKRSGTFYAWEDEGTAKRIRVTNSADRVGKSGQVSFWIAPSELK